ncbi:MAG TPA: PspC domain-containing protein [Candidatus Methylacidiphilales bacterium]|jgi:phage shock protein PspC (stress-responsive transcriptional regulator)|nr:PspC domain-containing protein [Candidatus Methylacidiphilales bacterium]
MTINMQGAVFEMEEEVWEKLKTYMESIKRSIGTAGNGYEISVDIENRLAEMLNERIGSAKRKLTIEDIDHVISSMGQPRDFVETEDLPAENSLNENPPRKRLVRDPDDKILGGVCSGIAAYFNIDPIFIRVLVAIAVLFSGAGIILYVVFWMIVPEGGTTKTKEELQREKLKRTKRVRLILWTMLLGAISLLLIYILLAHQVRAHLPI